MILNALDEVLFWDDIETLGRFIKENTQKYYPHDSKTFYEQKDIFLKKHIPTRENFLNRLKYYENNGSPIWVSSRNQLSDDIDLDTMIKAISISSQIENGKKKAEQASKWLDTNELFWNTFSENVLFSENNLILELTIGAGGGTNAIMRKMRNTDYYMGVDIDFVCAKNADAIAKYYEVNGLGIATSLWNLPFEDKMFTCVFTNAGLEECREIPAILKEAIRVLTENGRLVIRCLKPEKVLWYSQFAKYGFSNEDTVEWIKRVRLYADAEQIKSIVIDNGLICIEEIFDERLGHILIFEK